ncbi:MAG TPA: hypothetical protein VK980_04135, partial [Sphingomonas sp.]|nr:hypothetical protein [Sphingomonas sp.]
DAVAARGVQHLARPGRPHHAELLTWRNGPTLAPRLKASMSGKAGDRCTAGNCKSPRFAPYGAVRRDADLWEMMR